MLVWAQAGQVVLGSRGGRRSHHCRRGRGRAQVHLLLVVLSGSRRSTGSRSNGRCGRRLMLVVSIQLVLFLVLLLVLMRSASLH